MAKNDKKRSAAHMYLKYSGLAFQLATSIVVGWFLGSWIDQKLGFENPYIGILLAILFMVAIFYKLFKDLENDQL